MRHHSNVRKFGRERTQRHALMRSLACNLIRDSRIKTTLAKAKELRPYVEKLVTRAKVNSEASRRIINTRIQNPVQTKRLIEVVAPKYATRAGGYIRVMRLPNRELDASPMALIEFV